RVEETTLARRMARNSSSRQIRALQPFLSAGNASCYCSANLFLRLWRTAEPLSLLPANFRKSISSSVRQIVLLFFVRCKKNINQAFEFAPNLLQSVSNKTHPTHMSIGNYAGVGVCL